MINDCQYYCWNTYDSLVFDYEWWADIIHSFDNRKDAERLRPLRRAQSLLSSRVYRVRWYVSATGL